MKNKRLISMIVFLVAVGFVGYVITTTPPKVGISEGMLAPDFALPLWHTDEVVSLSSFRGEIVVLNLWASWCPPCRKEMPDLIRLSEDYQGKGVTVLGVNLATHERSSNDADEFMEEFGIEFPTFIDLPIEDGEGVVSSRYNINSIPYTYIIDQDGIILKVFSGEATYEMLETAIEEVK